MIAAAPISERLRPALQAGVPETIRHVILDRDGVLNEEAGENTFVTTPRKFQWLPGALEALAHLHAMGVRVSVATNQSGVGRGILSELDLIAIHEKMCLDAKEAGGSIDAIFCCPHGPDDSCTCRKPAPGLILAAVRESGILSSHTVVIGDAARDLDAARAAGARAILVRTGKGRQYEKYATDQGISIFDDLQAFTGELSLSPHESNIPGLLRSIFSEHIDVVTEAAQAILPALAECIHITRGCLARGNKILVCGNGGSAADAQHFVAELVGRYNHSRPALSAVVLGTDAATVTALSNDFGFEQVFARQVEALARSGDMLIALSTSGNSPNVINAAVAARELDCVIIALTGRSGGELAKHADITLRVPADSVARIQEVHGLCLHSLAQALDSAELSSRR
jgi:D-sedoheptulose 7-phosphate isomerase